MGSCKTRIFNFPAAVRGNGAANRAWPGIPLVELGCKLSEMEMGQCSKNLICDLSSLRDATGQLLGHIILSHSRAYRDRFFAPGLRN